jgi:hypothetical protein
VIVFSLLLASVTLPGLMRGLHFPANSRVQREASLAQEVMLQAALDSVAQGAKQRVAEQPDQASLYLEVADSLMATLRRQAGEAPDGASAEALAKQAAVERQLRLDAIAASREAVFQLARTHRISDALAREQVRLLDLHEAQLR